MIIVNLFFSLNIRSINAHLDELLLYLNSYSCVFDVIILYETWLLHDFNFKLNGYTNINSTGLLNKSDGVSMFIKDDITVLNTNKHFISNIVML